MMDQYFTIWRVLLDYFVHAPVGTPSPKGLGDWVVWRQLVPEG